MSDAELARVLRACLAGDPVAASAPVAAVVASGGTDQLLDAAQRHRVVDALAVVLRDVPGIDTGTLDGLRRRAAGMGAHQLRVLDDLRWLADRMAGWSIPWLAFKGPVVATLLYDPPTARSYQDLDLSIRREDFPAAIERLEDAGARLLDANWTLIRREGRGQLHFVLPLGTVADVHWHLLNRRSVRDSFRIEMADLATRSRSVTLDGLEVRTLDPVDTLLHLCLHAALGGADRLSWLEDVRRSIVVEEPAWVDVVERGSAWSAGPPVAVTLRRAKAVLHAPVPVWVLEELDASPVRRKVGEWVDRRWATDVRHARLGLATLWPQLVRDDVRSMAAIALFRAARPLVSGLHRLRGEPGRDQGSDAGAVFKPSGTREERDRFLRSVAVGDL